MKDPRDICLTRAAMGSIVVAAVCLVLAGCSQSHEDLSSCTEAETGYMIVDRTAGLSCGEARAVLGLLGDAEHGVQTVEEERGQWTCRAFPGESEGIKFRCKNGRQRFAVQAP
jgi:hypothetical protein